MASWIVVVSVDGVPVRAIYQGPTRAEAEALAQVLRLPARAARGQGGTARVVLLEEAGIEDLHHDAARSVEREMSGCEHEWVDATNEAVSNMDLCLKCGAVRSQRGREMDVSSGDEPQNG